MYQLLTTNVIIIYHKQVLIKFFKVNYVSDNSKTSILIINARSLPFHRYSVYKLTESESTVSDFSKAVRSLQPPGKCLIQEEKIKTKVSVREFVLLLVHPLLVLKTTNSLPIRESFLHESQQKGLYFQITVVAFMSLVFSLENSLVSVLTNFETQRANKAAFCKGGKDAFVEHI